MNNELLLQSNQPVPFPGARISIHNPNLKEIALIGEESFQAGVHFLNFSKNMLSSQDKSNLEDKTDFDIFMSVMLSKEKARYKTDVLSLLTLLFPDSLIKFKPEGITLTPTSGGDVSIINNDNFEEFKELLAAIFDLEEIENSASYHPADARAAKIAEKLSKGKQKIAFKKGQNVEKVAIFARYVSILAVGEKKDKNELMCYTVYQLKDEFRRWQLENAFNINLKARLAGATNLDEVENWMDDLHSSKSSSK